jgi:hypothetical protein
VSLTVIALTALAVGAGGALLWHYANGPLMHRGISPAQLERYVEALLARGYPSGFMVIEAPSSPAFLQFMKYRNPGGGEGVRCDFPLAPWSRSVYENVRGLAAAMGAGTEVIPCEGDRSQVTEFLLIDFERDVPRAAEFARRFFSEVLGLGPAALTLSYRGVGPAR